jgi:hypothetical protein
MRRVPAQSVPSRALLSPSQSGRVIAGGFLDANEVEHTYLRFPDGTFTTFDALGAGTGPFQGMGPNGINPAGAIVGPYTDASNVNHGFVRHPDGTITTFDPPGAGTGPGQGTLYD